MLFAALCTDGSYAQEADFAKFAFRPTTVASGKPKRCIAIFLKLPLALGCSILASYRSSVADKVAVYSQAFNVRCQRVSRHQAECPRSADTCCWLWM